MWTEAMWNGLLTELRRFPDAVLTGPDPTGHPTSVRCRPEPDDARRVLRCAAAPGLDLVDGPASLLCHTHDEKLWNMRSFLVRGRLAITGSGWEFTPGVLVSGPGMGSPVAQLRMFVRARRRAGRHLARRGLTRPEIPWSLLRDLR